MVYKPRYSASVTKKVLMLSVTRGPPNQESVLLETMKMIAGIVIPESGLVREDILITPIRVKTKFCGNQIMERSGLRPRVIFLYSKTLV